MYLWKSDNYENCERLDMLMKLLTVFKNFLGRKKT